jgi:hypothetical protein
MQANPFEKLSIFSQNYGKETQLTTQKRAARVMISVTTRQVFSISCSVKAEPLTGCKNCMDIDMSATMQYFYF